MPDTGYILDDQIIENNWVTLPEGFSGDLPEGKKLVPFSYWQSHPELAVDDNTGLWLTPDADVESLGDSAQQFPVIAIQFPTFMDGRGFSLGSILRSRYGFEGELRAIGNVIRDQLFFLKRCGFNAFELREGTELDKAVASLKDFDEVYQSSIDVQSPLFKRHSL